MNNQKLCECGCGLPTTINKLSNKGKGLVKGQPNRFLKGHRRQPTPITLTDILTNTKGSDTGCLEWQRGKDKNGYGKICIDYQSLNVHRLVYKLVHGAIPEGAVIRHRCDNPSCVNPEHLLAGTHADNANDKVLRGRSCAGTRNWSAVLTEAQVVDILASKEARKSLALRYGVSAVTISFIRLGRTWKHIPRVGASL